MESGWPNTKRSISMAFPTLIGQFEFPGAERVNQSLRDSILDRESKVPSDDHANQGGWHSPGNILESTSGEMLQMRNWITDALGCMVEATGKLPEARHASSPKGNFRLTAWANVSREGHYHRTHNHPGSAWSGVYYVSGTHPETPLDGVLELQDPRQFAEMTDTPCNPYGQRIHIPPAPGTMVVFPGWLYHFVHPLQSPGPRISIAFNAAWIAARS